MARPNEKVLDLDSRRKGKSPSKGGRKKSEKPDIKKIAFCFICVSIIIWSVTSIVIQEVKLSQIKKQEASYKTQIEGLKKEVADLQVEKTKSQGLDYVEKVAREKLKMVRPDEVIYYINSGVKDAGKNKN